MAHDVAAELDEATIYRSKDLRLHALPNLAWISHNRCGICPSEFNRQIELGGKIIKIAESYIWEELGGR